MASSHSLTSSKLLPPLITKVPTVENVIFISDYLQRLKKQHLILSKVKFYKKPIFSGLVVKSIGVYSVSNECDFFNCINFPSITTSSLTSELASYKTSRDYTFEEFLCTIIQLKVDDYIGEKTMILIAGIQFLLSRGESSGYSLYAMPKFMINMLLNHFSPSAEQLEYLFEYSNAILSKVNKKFEYFGPNAVSSSVLDSAVNNLSLSSSSKIATISSKITKSASDDSVDEFLMAYDSIVGKKGVLANLNLQYVGDLDLYTSDFNIHLMRSPRFVHYVRTNEHLYRELLRTKYSFCHANDTTVLPHYFTCLDENGITNWITHGALLNIANFDESSTYYSQKNRFYENYVTKFQHELLSPADTMFGSLSCLKQSNDVADVIKFLDDIASVVLAKKLVDPIDITTYASYNSFICITRSDIKDAKMIALFPTFEITYDYLKNQGDFIESGIIEKVWTLGTEKISSNLIASNRTVAVSKPSYPRAHPISPVDAFLISSSAFVFDKAELDGYYATQEANLNNGSLLPSDIDFVTKYRSNYSYRKLLIQGHEALYENITYSNVSEMIKSYPFNGHPNFPYNTFSDYLKDFDLELMNKIVSLVGLSIQSYIGMVPIKDASLLWNPVGFYVPAVRLVAKIWYKYLVSKIPLNNSTLKIVQLACLGIFSVADSTSSSSKFYQTDFTGISFLILGAITEPACSILKDSGLACHGYGMNAVSPNINALVEFMTPKRATILISDMDQSELEPLDILKWVDNRTLGGFSYSICFIKFQYEIIFPRSYSGGFRIKLGSSPQGDETFLVAYTGCSHLPFNLYPNLWSNVSDSIAKFVPKVFRGNFSCSAANIISSYASRSRMRVIPNALDIMEVVWSETEECCFNSINLGCRIEKLRPLLPSPKRIYDISASIANDCDIFESHLDLSLKSFLIQAIYHAKSVGREPIVIDVGGRIPNFLENFIPNTTCRYYVSDILVPPAGLEKVGMPHKPIGFDPSLAFAKALAKVVSQLHGPAPGKKSTAMRRMPIFIFRNSLFSIYNEDDYSKVIGIIEKMIRTNGPLSPTCTFLLWANYFTSARSNVSYVRKDPAVSINTGTSSDTSAGGSVATDPTVVLVTPPVVTPILVPVTGHIIPSYRCSSFTCNNYSATIDYDDSGEYTTINYDPFLRFSQYPDYNALSTWKFELRDSLMSAQGSPLDMLLRKGKFPSQKAVLGHSVLMKMGQVLHSFGRM